MTAPGPALELVEAPADGEKAVPMLLVLAAVLFVLTARQARRAEDASRRAGDYALELQAIATRIGS